VPLVVKGRATGVLRATAGGGTPGERERSMAETVATQLAITLENARLYHQLDTLFRSYLSADVATALLADPDRAALGGATVEVTALMADVVGFTTFSERSTPADVVTMLNAFYTAVVPEIVTTGGIVTQFVGDAVVALFGAPERHPDHAERACRAGLAFQEAVAAVRAEHPGWPQFRVGVNTGPALVGNIGSEEMRHYTAIGDTVNLAARLEAAAPHGRVVISATTLAAVGERAEVEPLGEITVKGKAEPVAAYVLGRLS
jgi:adenylate cyclase